LHRGSEFDNRAWMGKRLVGDPGKGFVRSQYRLVNEMPMIVSDDSQPFPPRIGEPPP
jgi:predicted transcriptional regulator